MAKKPAQPKKQTAAQIKAAAKAKEMANPLTGQPPNSFTQVTNRDLPPPVASRALEIDKHRMGREQKARREAIRSKATEAPMGYRLDDTIEERYQSFISGRRQMFPNTAAEQGTPAINEPHAAASGITVQRRAEDLSGPEYRKGEQALVQYGHLPSDPMKSLKESHRIALNRVTAEHIAAGVEESASQMFYGGHTTTDLGPGNEHLQAIHESNAMAANDRLLSGVRGLAMHPDFQARTPNLTHRERMSAATNLVAQAASDTSPQNKWRDPKSQNYPWPNLDQADEVVTAAAEDRPVVHKMGRLANTYKAKNRVDEAIDTGDFDVHKYGVRVSETGKLSAGPAKTVAFTGALIDKDSPDATRVMDVHDAGVSTPWLTTAKSHKYERLDQNTGERVGTVKEVFPDTPKADYAGMTRMTKSRLDKTTGLPHEVPDPGKSHAENMLSKGAGTVHALNDRAAREVLSEQGLSRGVNYADNVHTAQAAVWGSQQMARPDVNVSPADQYAVTRQWHTEGFNAPAGGDIRNLPHGGNTNLSRQFGLNEKTGRTQSIFPEDTSLHAVSYTPKQHAQIAQERAATRAAAEAAYQKRWGNPS